MNEDFSKVLEKLNNSLDDLKGRLIRIEERVEPIGDIKKDLDSLKLNLSEAVASTKSAHKRLDSIEKDVEALPTRAEFSGHDERIKKVERVIYWAGGIIVGGVLLALLSLVIIEK